MYVLHADNWAYVRVYKIWKFKNYTCAYINVFYKY